MRHLLISYHTCPTEEPGHDLAGGMNVLLRGFLAHTRVTTDVLTRSFEGYQRVELSPQVTLHRLPCGAARPWTREAAYDCLPRFEEALLQLLDRLPSPDVASAHYWMSGLFLPRLACSAGVMFHTLQAQKGPPQSELDEVRLETESRLIERYRSAYLHWHDLHHARSIYPQLQGSVLRPGLDVPESPKRPPDGPPWIAGWAARNDPIKNLDEGLDWLESHPDHRLLVAGMQGEDSDKARFLGPLRHSQMGAFYAQIHQLLNLSDYETFGLSVLEALAAGASVGVHAHSDWARRLRRLGLPFAPGIRYNEKEQAVARRLALSYSWSRSLLRWERWLQHLSPSGS